MLQHKHWLTEFKTNIWKALKSLFYRMGFVQRICTRTKPEIAKKSKQDLMLYQHQILMLRCNLFPRRLSSFLTRRLITMLQSLISRSLFKQAITGTFGITCENKFLLMQLIYGGRPKEVSNEWNFLIRFRFSNTLESLKLLNESYTILLLSSSSSWVNIYTGWKFQFMYKYIYK